MEDEKFKITCEGEIKKGWKPEQVKQRLAKLFKTDTSKIEKFFSGVVVIIKRDLTRETAEKFKETIEDTGLVCRIVSDAAAPEPKKCPNCGYAATHLQDPLFTSGECLKCGIIVSKFLKSREAAETPPPVDQGSPMIQLGAATQNRSGFRSALFLLFFLGMIVAVYLTFFNASRVEISPRAVTAFQKLKQIDNLVQQKTGDLIAWLISNESPETVSEFESLLNEAEDDIKALKADHGLPDVARTTLPKAFDYYQKALDLWRTLVDSADLQYTVDLLNEMRVDPEISAMMAYFHETGKNDDSRVHEDQYSGQAFLKVNSEYVRAMALSLRSYLLSDAGSLLKVFEAFSSDPKLVIPGDASMKRFAIAFTDGEAKKILSKSLRSAFFYDDYAAKHGGYDQNFWQFSKPVRAMGLVNEDMEGAVFVEFHYSGYLPGPEGNKLVNSSRTAVGVSKKLLGTWKIDKSFDYSRGLPVWGIADMVSY